MTILENEMKLLEQNEYLKEVSNWGEIYRYVKKSFDVDNLQKKQGKR